MIGIFFLSELTTDVALVIEAGVLIVETTVTTLTSLVTTLTGVGVLELALRFFEAFPSFESLLCSVSTGSPLESFFSDLLSKIASVATLSSLLALLELEILFLSEFLVWLWTVFCWELVDDFEELLEGADLFPRDDFRLLELLDGGEVLLFGLEGPLSISFSELESELWDSFETGL